MADSYCEGCGAPLQSERPDEFGFVPAHVLTDRPRGVVCRRCYRITHYGREEQPLARGADLSHDRLRAAIRSADLVLWIVDAIDMEGTFDRRAAELARGKLLVAVNKIDLLPPRTPKSEVQAWVEKRLAGAGIPHEGVFLVSAADGYGVRGLWDRAAALLGRSANADGARAGTVLLFGATNVGKSTLLNAWLQTRGGHAPGGAGARGVRGKESPSPAAATVAPYAGTTQGLVRREFDSGRITVVDSPGFFASGRMSDLLCSECASLLVPVRGLKSDLHRLRAGQAIAFGGLAAVELVAIKAAPDEPQPQEVVVLTFAAPAVRAHRTRGDRPRAPLDDTGREWLLKLCERCRAHLAATGWEEVIVDVREMDDLAIHGLGWISARGADVAFRVSVPAGVQAQVRPRLVGPKSPATRRPANERASRQDEGEP